jgi:hypothetical protein
MLKKAVQQDRSERRGEEVHPALCVSRSPITLILVNGYTPPVDFSSRRVSERCENAAGWLFSIEVAAQYLLHGHAMRGRPVLTVGWGRG